MATTRNNRRKGATIVEFAITIPFVVLFFFSAFEFSRLNLVRHTVDIAAYEGARRGIVPGASTTDVSNRVDDVLAATFMSAPTVSVTPNPIDRATRTVTVDVLVPLDSNGWILPQFVGGLDLRSTSTLAREGFISPDP